MIKRLVLLILSLILFQGCKTQRIFTKTEYQHPTYRQLLNLHEQWQQSIKTFSGKGRITVDTPRLSQNFEANIYAKGDDSLLISVSGFMGTEVGKVFVGKNRFIFFNQYDNQFVTGRREDFDKTQFMQFPISISGLREVFLAEDHFTILKNEKFQTLPDGYFLKAQNGSSNYNIWFDNETLLIKKIEYLKDDQILYFKEYKQYKEYNGLYFPRIINFVRPTEKQGISIIFKEIYLNQPLPDHIFKIKVGDNAKQVIFPAN